MPATRLLIVDDDLNLLEILSMRLSSGDYQIETATDTEEALEIFSKQHIDLAIIDLQLARESGLDLMEKLHEISRHIPVIILTAYGSIESAVEAMRKGAYTYLTKPFDPRELLFQIKNALQTQRLSDEIKRLKGFVEERYHFRNIIAKSEKMNTVLMQISRVAETDSTIFIYGESGTGKELIAKTIHLASHRKENPFVAINCAAIPETLLERELFGHEKGAFTGAHRSSSGLFLQADKGTIFLDEIGDMPLITQAKLLRVLQESQFYPLGSEKPVNVNVRVIVATNKDLEAEMKKGQFREDLFYRIHVIPISIPPLRERREDIPLLADHFLKKFSLEMKKDIKGITPATIKKLMAYDWPGNVRELINTIEYAVVMTNSNFITDDMILKLKDIETDEESMTSLKEAKDAFEKKYLVRLLESTSGNVSKASKLARKYRADFYNLLKKYDIKPETFKKS
jgi:two-component system response regulator GlrR